MKQLAAFEVDDLQKYGVDAADKHDGGGLLRPSRICYLVVLSTTFWTLLFYVHSSMQGGDGVASVLFKPSAFSLPVLSSIAGGRRPPPEQPPVAAAQGNRSVAAPADRCAGRYVYMYDLPPRFNDDLVRDCRMLWFWSDFCPYVANCGMGEEMGDEGGVFSSTGWYHTDQFMLDIIFHGRMKSYECLTGDSSLAAAVFVPFYASLDGGRYLYNGTAAMRDALVLDLLEWLARRPEWQAMGGRDHFFVASRTEWDFRRFTDSDDEWGTKLLHIPAVRNMTALLLETTIEESTLAVPYPTYFHPATAAEVAAWQEKVRRSERKWLFSFAGAPRPGSNFTVRAQIIQQCGASSRCRLFHCGPGGGSCSSPGGVMRVFQSSDFCLQPRGDTLTRRSTFDTILAGCIPVFFHPGSAYTQYTTHFPRDPKSYSVLIMHTDVTAGNVSIEETLSKIPPETVRTMREEVIRLIPRVVYADPRSRRVDFKDAFDVAVEAVIDRVAKRRRDTAAGRE
ncbi:hypothetical protein ACP70R_019212 [Stipagrostis hirtigluma subsp. patula]